MTHPFSPVISARYLEVPDSDFCRLGGELFAGQFSGIRLHGQPVVGRSPQLVEFLVAFPATHRASVGINRRHLCRFRGWLSAKAQVWMQNSYGDRCP